MNTELFNLTTQEPQRPKMLKLKDLQKIPPDTKLQMFNRNRGNRIIIIHQIDPKTRTFLYSETYNNEPTYKRISSLADYGVMPYHPHIFNKNGQEVWNAENYLTIAPSSP